MQTKLAPGRDGKLYYRTVYLKSPHWSNLRLEKLTDVDACCERCGKRDLSNDVHHLRYKKLYDVTLDDLVVLCRKCHDLTHQALDIFRLRVITGKEDKAWRATLKAIVRTRRMKRKAASVLNRMRKEVKLAKQIKRGEIPPPALRSMEPNQDKEKRPHFQELGDVFRDLRKQGCFSFLIVEG